MAKLSVLEGQLERNFSGVKLLRTDLSGGGSCEWIPEDKIQLTTLNISKNGTYKASDYGDRDGNKYYGFSEVTVNVTGRTTIVDPDDGNEYSVETDTETGELKKTILPSSIDIVGLPTKTTYREGDPINKSGMIVKAYLADGTLYNYKNYQFGGIPLSELEIEPTKASGGEKPYNEKKYEGYVAKYNIDNEVTITPHHSLSTYEKYIASNGTSPIYKFGTRYNSGSNRGVGGFICSKEWFSCDKESSPTQTIHVTTQSYTQNGKTVYFAGRNAYQDYFEPTVDAPLNEVDSSGVGTIGANMCAWIICYGEDVSGGEDDITVKWKRPEDNKELTDIFKITVIPANTSGGESGEDNTGDDNTTGGGGGSW